ncbi:MAG: transposase family protein [Pseudomonadales bacterium]
MERLNWRAPYAQVTMRMAASVAALCTEMSLRHVAQFYRRPWTAVKRIDQRHLEQELGPVDLNRVTVIAMDESAIQKWPSLHHGDCRALEQAGALGRAWALARGHPAVLRTTRLRGMCPATRSP